jgi:hypothetical protein
MLYISIQAANPLAWEPQSIVFILTVATPISAMGHATIGTV